MKDAELDGCTFYPELRGGGQSLPAASYVVSEERQYQLQHYLESQSYGGQSDEDEFAEQYYHPAQTQTINYVNNL